MILPGSVEHDDVPEGTLHPGIIMDKAVRHDNELTAGIKEARQAGDQGLGRDSTINLLPGVKGKV